MKAFAVGLAVALIAAGSATAAFVVTSKNIKNGTIQLVDISAKAKEALRAEPLTHIQSPPTIIAPEQTGTAEATCPDGQEPISGGFFGPQWARVIGSGANGPRRSWIVAAFNTSSTTTAVLNAIVDCSPNVTITIKP
jgi:hypothetical protein